MRHSIPTIILIFALNLTARSQEVSVPAFKPYFSAIIVRDVDSSMKWYQDVFGLKVANRFDDLHYGFRIVVLESASFVAELIENKSWPDQKTLLEDRPPNTRVQGFFKIGFKIGDLDVWVKRLAHFKIIPEKIYTDDNTMKRNFLVEDPDKNLIQFFE